MMLFLFLMIRRPPRSTRTDTSFPTRRFSDLNSRRHFARASRPAHAAHASHRQRGGMNDRSSDRDQRDPYQWDVVVVGASFSGAACDLAARRAGLRVCVLERKRDPGIRSEEHTSELQSLMRSSYAVFCLKKQKHRKAKWK